MRERWIVRALEKAQPPGGWKTILDVGCGDGLFFDRLSEFGDVEGVEPASEIIDATAPHLHRIHRCPFDASFRPGKKYSLILLLDVLEHLSEPLDALRHCALLLEPEGLIFITVPAFNSVWTNHDAINHHKTRYRKATLFPLLRSAGLKIEDSAYWFHWTFPVKLAQRLIENAFHIAPRNPVIPGRLANRLLCWACSLEHTVLGPLRLPFGTSLVVRCRI